MQNSSKDTVDEWKTVSRKGKQTNKKNMNKFKLPYDAKIKHDKILKSAVVIDSLYNYNITHIRKCVQSLRTSTIFAAVSNSLTQLSQSAVIDSIIGLGIGSFSKSPSSLLQFSLLLLLRESLSRGETQSDVIKCSIFDPNMSSDDMLICSELGISVNSDNKMGKYDVAVKTLFFMPHCPYRLYCNLLWQNWHTLNNVYILGNSFQSYNDRRIVNSVVTTREKSCDTVQLLTPCMIETRIWNSAFVKDSRHVSELAYLENAFSDLSFLRFPSAEVDNNSNNNNNNDEEEEEEVTKSQLFAKIVGNEMRAEEADIDEMSRLDVELF